MNQHSFSEPLNSLNTKVLITIRTAQLLRSKIYYTTTLNSLPKMTHQDEIKISTTKSNTTHKYAVILQNIPSPEISHLFLLWNCFQNIHLCQQIIVSKLTPSNNEAQSL